MAGWKIQPTKRVDLPEDVADGLWISIYHPKLLPYEVAQKLMSMQNVSDGSASIDDLTALATPMIVDWNLPGDDGAVLPIPGKDPEVWKKIPTIVVAKTVLGALGEGVATSIPDPNSSDGSASS